MEDIEMLSEELPLGAADGKSLPDAIREKYLGAEPLSRMITEGLQIVSNMPVMKDSNSGKVKLPPCLSLDYCCIVGAGEEGEVETLCRNVKELDVSENNLCEWREVLAITGQIPQLSFLNLSSNPLGVDIPKELTPVPQLDRLASLVLNNTRVPWPALHTLLDSTPLLEQLHLSLNKYGTVNLSERQYTSVKLLQFNRNDVTSWADVTKLGQMFPNLERLFLSENGLMGLDQTVGGHFPRLRSLCVSETRLAHWEEVEALDAFPSVVEARLQRVPLLDGYSDQEHHQLTIAWLPRRVMRLNGSRISEEERDEAERAFIRCYMDRDDKPDRYHTLLAVHGNLQPLAEVDLRPKLTVKCLVRLGDQAREYELSVKLTCMQLKRKLQDFAGIPPSKFRLYYQGTQLMMYPAKVLYTYKINDGDEIHIHKLE